MHSILMIYLPETRGVEDAESIAIAVDLLREYDAPGTWSVDAIEIHEGCAALRVTCDDVFLRWAQRDDLVLLY